MPGLSISASDDVKSIRSSVVISNHRSYLDPILLISIFPKHKTIVKGSFFVLPIMGWVLRSCGYIPHMPGGEYTNFMRSRIQNIPEFLERGGNLFIFPEGRRSRNGSLASFQKGAFTIAGKYKIPLQVIYIHNTDRLFAPGKFFLNTCVSSAITVEKLGSIDPSKSTVREMREKAIALYAARMKKNKIFNRL